MISPNLSLCILLLLVAHSCQQPIKYEPKTCQTNQIPDLNYQIGSSILLDTLKTFNGQCSVKKIANKIYFISEVDQKIKAYHINNKITQSILNYDFIGENPYDFWNDSSGTYLLFRNPNQFIHINENKEIQTLFSTEMGVQIQTYPFLNDKLIIDPSGDFIASSFSLTDPSKNKYLFKYNNIDGSRRKAFEKFPAIFRHSLFPLLSSPSKIRVKDKSIIAYGFSENIKCYQDTMITETYCARSKYLDQNITALDLDASFQETSNFIIKNAFYLGLYYNAFEHRYYRIVKHSQALKLSNGQLNNRYVGPWSIIVLDEFFGYIGEIKMPPNQYDYYAAITLDTPGIWMAKKGSKLEFEQLLID